MDAQRVFELQSGVNPVNTGQFTGRFTRLSSLFTNPQALKGYLAEHCSTQVVRANHQQWIFFSPGYLPTDAVGATKVQVCINETYVQDAIACDSAPRRCNTVQFGQHSHSMLRLTFNSRL